MYSEVIWGCTLILPAFPPFPLYTFLAQGSSCLSSCHSSCTLIPLYGVAGLFLLPLLWPLTGGRGSYSLWYGLGGKVSSVLSWLDLSSFHLYTKFLRLNIVVHVPNLELLESICPSWVQFCSAVICRSNWSGDGRGCSKVVKNWQLVEVCPCNLFCFEQKAFFSEIAWSCRVSRDE